MRVACASRMDTLLQDVRYALRTLARTPAFTGIALVTLAVGTGANLTVFAFVDALLFRPAPGVTEPRRLVAIYTSDFSSGPYGASSYPDFLSISHEVPAFQKVAAEQDDAIGILRANDAIERVRVASVTGAYFEVLGMQAVTGRLLTEADGGPSAPRVAVIGFDLWQRVFRSDPHVIGGTLHVLGETYAIVGVAPHRFSGLHIGRTIDLWTPLRPPPPTPGARGNRALSIVARLRDGVPLAEGHTQLSTIAERLAADYPDTNRGILGAPTAARPMIALRHTRLPPQFREPVAVVGAVSMAAVGLVLVIVCANVASLLLSRATARHREIAVRLALGASRRRIVRQLITESLLLGFAGGALGLLVSLWTADLLPSFFPPDQAGRLDTGVNALTFGLTAALACLTSLLFGLAPALHAVRPATADALRGESDRMSEGRAGKHLRRGLVVAQVAVAVVLIASAALLVRSLVNQLNADLGFGIRDAILASVELPPEEFTAAQRQQYYQDVAARVRSMPGVKAASFVRALLSGTERRRFRMEGYTARPGEDSELHHNIVGERYFETMQIPLVAGREFDGRDRRNGLPVVIVNDVLANRYFDGRALGRPVTDSRGTVLEIVGVVRSSRHLSIQEGHLPVVYYPLSQSDPSRLMLVAATSTNTAGMIGPVREQMRAVNPAVPVFRTVTLASHISEVVATDRLTAALVGVCGALALLLAAVGVYGVIAYSVVRRTRELGVRIALGARPGHIIRLVVAEGLAVTAVGIALGFGGSIVSGRALGSLLYQVSPSDGVTYAMIPVVLATVTLIAALAPAGRALRLDPVEILRND